MSVAAKNPPTYHHGNLKEAFIKIASELLEQDGLAGLSMRKCAERVGVSHTAPKNHFGNMAGLLTAVVTRGYEQMAIAMVGDGSSLDRTERRNKALLGYIAFAERNPALYELMFARDRVVNNDPELMKQVGACFKILADISKDLGWYNHRDLDSDAAEGLEQVALWSFVHGYAQLLTAKRFKKDNMQNLIILDVLPEISTHS